MSFTVYLVRHGASEAYINQADEEADIIRQQPSTPLSSLGSSQSHLLGRQLSVFRPDLLITSQYIRARQTADIIAEYSPLFVNTDQRLNELKRIVDGLSMYSDENLNFKTFRGNMLKNADINAKFFPTDNSLAEGLADMISFQQMLIKECQDQKVVVVGHSQKIALWLANIKRSQDKYGKDSDHKLVSYFNKFFMDNAAITKMKYDKGTWDITFNITDHLKNLS